MSAPRHKSPIEQQRLLIMFDLRHRGAAERLHREHTAWQKDCEIEALDENYFVLLIRPGGALWLAT